VGWVFRGDEVRVTLDISALRRTKWYEYLIRFCIGGAVTVVAALIAKRFGAGIGGLFLAFPAIFPSTATLIASHEKQKKAEAGTSGTLRARQLAGADAAGAAMGGIGLVGFAALTWRAIEGHSTLATLALATLVWMVVSFVMWEGREKLWRKARRRLSHSDPANIERRNISHQGKQPWN
jgi:hypothetical protein